MPSKTTLVGTVVVLALLAGGIVAWKLCSPTVSNTSSGTISIDASSGNYGLFIDNTDNNYFSTRDVNVKNIFQKYLANPYQFSNPTDAQKYGYSVVYYYDKNAFIVGEKSDPSGNVTAYTMHDMETGKKISSCAIVPNAGLYMDNDLLLSVALTEPVPGAKSGVCLYQRSASNFIFIDLTSRLTSTETFFNDPTGQNLKASIKSVDAQHKTFVVDIYDTTQRDLNGNYAYKRSIEVSY